MVKDKLKSLISLSGQTQIEISPKFDMSKESFNNKLRGARFNIFDLIKLASLTDTTLVFLDNKTGKPLISFDDTDI